jgi:hypothetical protein
MHLPLHRLWAERIAKRLTDLYGNALVCEPRPYAGRGWWVAVSRPGEQGGLLFYPGEIDNGAAGIRPAVTSRLNAYRDREPWTPPVPAQRVVHDVMTFGPVEGVVTW